MPDEAPRAWTVVEQRQTTQVTPGGQFIDAMEVSLAHENGTPFQITVPLREYSAERVAVEANMIAAEISRVGAL